jgi:hypothetical protein
MATTTSLLEQDRNHQSKLIKFSGFKLMRSNPAAAKTAPFNLLRSTFFIRKFTFPRRSTTLCVGYLFSHCAWRRKLPVAIVPDSLENQDCLYVLKYQVLALHKTAWTIPCGKAVGTSFIECTAISTSPLIMATSSVL